MEVVSLVLVQGDELDGPEVVYILESPEGEFLGNGNGIIEFVLSELQEDARDDWRRELAAMRELMIADPRSFRYLGVMVTRSDGDFRFDVVDGIHSQLIGPFNTTDETAMAVAEMCRLPARDPNGMDDYVDLGDEGELDPSQMAKLMEKSRRQYVDEFVRLIASPLRQCVENAMDGFDFARDSVRFPSEADLEAFTRRYVAELMETCTNADSERQQAAA